MSICKDCYHYGVCGGYMPTDLDDDEVLEYCAKGLQDEVPNIEELCDEFKHYTDVVEVVRCKDCQYWTGEDYDGCCIRNGLATRYANDYCSYGERKDDE